MGIFKQKLQEKYTNWTLPILNALITRRSRLAREEDRKTITQGYCDGQNANMDNEKVVFAKH